MEQLLINQLIELLCKGGSGSLIKDLLRETDQDGNAKKLDGGGNGKRQ